MWPWRRKKRRPKPVTPPEPSDPLNRDPKTRQGKPDARRCRLCDRTRVYRTTGTGLLYCPVCDHITPRKGTTTP